MKEAGKSEIRQEALKSEETIYTAEDRRQAEELFDMMTGGKFFKG